MNANGVGVHYEYRIAVVRYGTCFVGYCGRSAKGKDGFKTKNT